MIKRRLPHEYTTPKNLFRRPFFEISPEQARPSRLPKLMLIVPSFIGAWLLLLSRHWQINKQFTQPAFSPRAKQSQVSPYQHFPLHTATSTQLYSMITSSLTAQFSTSDHETSTWSPSERSLMPIWTSQSTPTRQLTLSFGSRVLRPSKSASSLVAPSGASLSIPMVST